MMKSATVRLPRGSSRRRGLLFCLMAGLLAYAGLGVARAAPAVSVDHPWVRFLLPTLPAGGYMTLHNATGHKVVLRAVHAAACGAMMLHKTVHAHHREEMVPVRSVAIPPHGSFAFSPGAYHVMCMRPQMKPGETVPVTLEFDHAPPLTVPFRVYGATGRPASQ